MVKNTKSKKRMRKTKIRNKKPSGTLRKSVKGGGGGVLASAGRFVKATITERLEKTRYAKTFEEIKTNLTKPGTEEYKLYQQFLVSNPNSEAYLEQICKSVISSLGNLQTSIIWEKHVDQEYYNGLLQLLRNEYAMSAFIYLYIKSKSYLANRWVLRKLDITTGKHLTIEETSRAVLFVVYTAIVCWQGQLFVFVNNMSNPLYDPVSAVPFGKFCYENGRSKLSENAYRLMDKNSFVLDYVVTYNLDAQKELDTIFQEATPKVET